MPSKVLSMIMLILMGGILPLQAEELTGTLKKIKDSHAITVGYRESAVPFSYLDAQGQPMGYSHGLMKNVVEAVKAKLEQPDLEVKSIPVTAQNRIPLLLNQTIDLECGSTTNNAERRKQVAFSNTFFIAGVRLMAKKDSGIKDFPDLARKNVVTTRGTTSETLLRKLNSERNLKMKVTAAKEHGEAFLNLEQGKSVAFVMDDVLLAGERAKARNPEDWVIAGTPQSREAYGCMLRKDDAPFKQLVDDALAGLMKSGEAETLYRKWFESPIPPKGINLNYPLSEDMKALFANPNDQSFE
jgi:glutamate/aspartate transport system substrate-binding protein